MLKQIWRYLHEEGVHSFLASGIACVRLGHSRFRCDSGRGVVSTYIKADNLPRAFAFEGAPRAQAFVFLCTTFVAKSSPGPPGQYQFQHQYQYPCTVRGSNGPETSKAW